MTNHDDLNQLCDDAIHALQQVKRRLTDTEDTPDDVPKFDEWDEVNANKWRCRLDHLDLFIQRRDGSYYWWYVFDRRAKRRVAAGCKGRPTARNARSSARRWYLDYRERGAGESY